MLGNLTIGSQMSLESEVQKSSLSRSDETPSPHERFLKCLSMVPS